MTFPIALNKIGIFERNNMSVNVLAIADEKLCTLRKAKFDTQRRTASLLLIDQEGKRHYVVIKNLSRLLSSSNGEHQDQPHFCLNCLQGFHIKESRNKHFKYCVDHKAVRISTPQENSFVRFHSGQYQFKVPFVVCTDYEAILQGLEEKTGS